MLVAHAEVEGKPKGSAAIAEEPVGSISPGMSGHARGAAAQGLSKRLAPVAQEPDRPLLKPSPKTTEYR